MSVLINANLPNAVALGLEKVSLDTKKTQSFLIRKAVENFIQDYNDFYIASQRLNDKNDQVVSIEEMRVSLGL